MSTKKLDKPFCLYQIVPVYELGSDGKPCLQNGKPLQQKGDDGKPVFKRKYVAYYASIEGLALGLKKKQKTDPTDLYLMVSTTVNKEYPIEAAKVEEWTATFLAGTKTIKEYSEREAVRAKKAEQANAKKAKLPVETRVEEPKKKDKAKSRGSSKGKDPDKPAYKANTRTKEEILAAEREKEKAKEEEKKKALPSPAKKKTASKKKSEPVTTTKQMREPAPKEAAPVKPVCSHKAMQQALAKSGHQWNRNKYEELVTTLAPFRNDPAFPATAKFRLEYAEKAVENRKLPDQKAA